MKQKSIGGVRFRVRKLGGDLRLEITAGDGVTHVLPARTSLQLHHVQSLRDWLKLVEDEMEYGE